MGSRIWLPGFMLKPDRKYLEVHAFIPEVTGMLGSLHATTICHYVRVQTHFLTFLSNF